MNTNYAKIAQDYYKFLEQKDEAAIKELVHPNITFKAPLAQLSGKNEFVEAALGYASMVEAITIKDSFESENKAVIIYEANIPRIMQDFPTAAYFTFENGLIKSLDLFYDARAFSK